MPIPFKPVSTRVLTAHEAKVMTQSRRDEVIQKDFEELMNLADSAIRNADHPAAGVSVKYRHFEAVEKLRDTLTDLGYVVKDDHLAIIIEWGGLDA